MKRNKIKTKFIKHELLGFIICGIILSGFLTAGCAYKIPETQKNTDMDNAVNVINSALNNARSSKTGNAVIDLNNNPERVQIGDLASVRYCLKLENGEVLRTNIREVLDNRETILSDNYIEPFDLNDLEVLAGVKDAFPGLHSGVIGMEKGETKNIFIPSEEGYGPKRDNRIKTFSSVKFLPKKTGINPEKFHELFKAEPVKGSLVHLVPYFYHRIIEINEKEVILEAEIKDSFSLKSEIGDTKIYLEGNNVAITLEPKQGADFFAGNEKGRIVSIDEKNFTVDFNHPLSGKNLVLELTVDSIIKASTVKNWKIPWHEDYDEGFATAENSGKPVALFLYEDGCPWCRKLFTETMNDPRVTKYRDDFIWIKTNGEDYPDVTEVYDQKLFPAVIFLGSRGEEIKRLSGFKYAPVLREELNKVIHITENKRNFL